MRTTHPRPLFYRVVVGILLSSAICGTLLAYFPGARAQTGGYWGAQTPSAVTIGGGSLAASTWYYNGYLYALVNYKAEFVSDSGPNLGTWSTTTNYPTAVIGYPIDCGSYNGFLNCVGGGYTYSSATSPTWYAAISSSGIGSWTSTTAYPVNGGVNPGAEYNIGCAQDAGHYLVCVGGSNQQTSVTNKVYSSLMASTGGFGAWTSQTVVPTSDQNYQVAIVGGYIYAIDGTHGYFATENGAGTVGGSWTTLTNSLPSASLSQQVCWAFNGEFFCVGNTSTVYYLSSLGSAAATWTADTNYWPVAAASIIYAAQTCTSLGVTFVNCVGPDNTSNTFGAPIAVTTTTTTATTTVTTQATVTNALLQVGGIPANSSSFALFSKTPEMIYVQNPVASAASLTNVTLKLAAVDITSSTATLYLGIYQQNNPNQVPSASNPMQLINPTISYNIANGTTGFIHVPIAEIQINGPITICGFCYWGIGIWTNGNHSSGASNSGVYLYQASVANTVGGSAPTDALCGPGLGHVGYPWEYLPNQATSVGLPSNWYFIACSLQKNLAYVAFISYGVAIVYAGSITQTVTTATTITLSTGTTTVTTTANAASQATIQGANFYLAVTLIVGLFMVGIWSGGLGGGMLGAIIGEVVGIAAGLFTGGQATLILVSTLIGCAAAFALGQGSRGRGFGL